jgi:hypothetical protein
MVYELTERARGAARAFDRRFAVVTAEKINTKASVTLDATKIMRRATAVHSASSSLRGRFG